MDKFIYVFSVKQYDELSAAGFTCLKKDTKNNIYIFENKPDIKLNFSNQDFVFSNTLSF